jgi:hypothetical protein
MVRLQAAALCHFIHQCSGPKALGNDLCLNVVWPMPLRLTSRLPGRENLQCTLHGETPVLIHGKAITDHGGEDNVGAEHRLP